LILHQQRLRLLAIAFNGFRSKHLQQRTLILRRHRLELLGKNMPLESETGIDARYVLEAEFGLVAKFNLAAVKVLTPVEG
jgi:regulatory protein YycI of two-component signal transduction system YycFG